MTPSASAPAPKSLPVFTPTVLCALIDLDHKDAVWDAFDRID